MEKNRTIVLKEVAPRDGFQMEKQFIPTEKKIGVIDLLSSSGLKKIQFTAFMHPKAIPNMADAEEVVRGIKRAPGALYQALIANQRGYERAAAAGIEEVEFTLSATNSHNMSNVNSSTEESFKRIEECVLTFQQLKEYLSHPPIMSSLEVDEVLFAYVIVAPHVVSLVLI